MSLITTFNIFVMHKKHTLYLLLLAPFLTIAQTASSGWLIAPSIKWGIFSFQPLTGEKTPNYHAIAPSLSLGYSIRQVLDLGIHTLYVPGTRFAAKPGLEHAALAFAGGEIAFRVRRSVYLGIRGGDGFYQLSTSPQEEGEFDGKWSGPAGGASLGAIFRRDKQSFWQLTLDIMHWRLTKTYTPDERDKLPGWVVGMERKVDLISFSWTYVYNDFQNFLTSNSIMSNFLDRIIFWR